MSKANKLPARTSQSPSKQFSKQPETISALAQMRIAIEGVAPQIDGGRFFAKRVVGDSMTAEADIFCDGHEKLGAALLYRRANQSGWQETPMHHFDNDRWRGSFPLVEAGRYVFTIIAWRDLYASWRDEVIKPTYPK